MPSLPKSIYQWSIADVLYWLTENGFEQETESFKAHQIDGRALALLYRCDLKEVIRRVGPRVKFRAKLSQLLTSRGMKNNMEPKETRNNNNNNNATSFYDPNFGQHVVMPMYGQYGQRPPSYQQNNGMKNNQSNGFYQRQQQQMQQRNYYQQQKQQPIRMNDGSNQPINDCQQNISTDGNAGMNSNEPIKNQNTNNNANKTCDCMTVKPCDFRSVKRPRIGDKPDSAHVSGCTSEQSNIEKCSYTKDEVDIIKFVEGAGFKKEPIDASESSASVELKTNGPYLSPSFCRNSSTDNNENLDPTHYKNIYDGASLNGSNDGGNSPINPEDSAMEDDEHFPVLDITERTIELENKLQNDGINIFQNGCHNNNTNGGMMNSKLGIEAVTNRLALRERSKIFRRSEKKWHVAVNETAYQLVLKEPSLLMRKKDLRTMAETEVRKTYRFAKGKSRSIAIPENRAAAEERKKQRLTREKIEEMKRQLKAEGEELSRQMRQCQVNIQLASQQSDMTRSAELRDEMQKLNQQQAKIHFSMHELLTKERKLDAGINKMMQNGHAPTMSMVNTQHQMMDLSDFNSNPETNDDPTLTSPTQLVSFVASQPTTLSPLNSVLPPQSVLLSPEDPATGVVQINMDGDGSVMQFSNHSGTQNDILVVNGEGMTTPQQQQQEMTSSPHFSHMENNSHAYVSM